jgi:hypothetical protein
MKRIIHTILLILKDLIVLSIACFFLTFTICVCVENGWAFTKHAVNIPHYMFWGLYSSIHTIVPFILFYKGCLGRYNVKIQTFKIEAPAGKAVAVEVTDDTEHQ